MLKHSFEKFTRNPSLLIPSTNSRIFSTDFKTIKRISINCNEFSRFSQSNYIYVDKTPLIASMIQSGKFYSISRPDSFGKTLLLKTIKEIFEGNQSLFNGTYIFNKPELFQKTPVLFYDFGITFRPATVSIFTEMIKNLLQKSAETYQIKLNKNLPVHEMFGNLIEGIKDKLGPVVILIDNFDKITLETIQYQKKRNDLIEILTKILASLKEKEENIKFFVKTNTSLIGFRTYLHEKIQIKDITLDSNFSQILGFSDEELKNNFGDYLNFYESQSTLLPHQIKSLIKSAFGGYRFTSENKELYNPQGFLNYLSKGNPDDFEINLSFPKYMKDYLQQNFVYGMPIKEFAGNFEILSQEYFKEALNKKWGKNHVFQKKDFFLTDANNLELHLFNHGFMAIKDYNEEKNEFEINYVNNTIRRNLIKVYDEVYEKSKSYVEPFSG
ncbi:unnamed protein product [Blepharisma stoltei]|uniref:AAA-ATPase-like domain-containing protein n=1 Tax=Blepharisma stoltei TaxID=1481888 RepID=A0AAU9IUL6_9CILI|nr:unnamed protein product [Blepharisma stoltei]